MYGRVGGLCIATILFVCGVTGFPVPPGSQPASVGPVTVLLSGSRVVQVPEGSTVTVRGGGFADSAAITFALYSSPVEVGTAVADLSGAVSGSVRLPSGVTGSHTIVALGNAPDGSARVLDATLEITPAPVTAGALARTGIRAAEFAVAGVLLVITGFGLVRTAALRRRLLPER